MLCDVVQLCVGVGLSVNRLSLGSLVWVETVLENYHQPLNVKHSVVYNALLSFAVCQFTCCWFFLSA